jgi:hypothetical protein
MTAPVVVMHRPPLRRIDTARRPRVVEPEEYGVSPGSLALRQLGAKIEQERIWELLRQSAEGCNQIEVAK